VEIVAPVQLDPSRRGSPREPVRIHGRGLLQDLLVQRTEILEGQMSVDLDVVRREAEEVISFLDTVEPVMKDAVAMYRRLGFREIAPYRLNPIPGALYMELEL